jgi:hypothetical protein
MGRYAQRWWALRTRGTAHSGASTTRAFGTGKRGAGCLSRAGTARTPSHPLALLMTQAMTQQDWRERTCVCVCGVCGLQQRAPASNVRCSGSGNAGASAAHAVSAAGASSGSSPESAMLTCAAQAHRQRERKNTARKRKRIADVRARKAALLCRYLCAGGAALGAHSLHLEHHVHA